MVNLTQGSALICHKMRRALFTKINFFFLLLLMAEAIKTTKDFNQTSNPCQSRYAPQLRNLEPVIPKSSKKSGSLSINQKNEVECEMTVNKDQFHFMQKIKNKKNNKQHGRAYILLFFGALAPLIEIRKYMEHL